MARMTRRQMDLVRWRLGLGRPKWAGCGNCRHHDARTGDCLEPVYRASGFGKITCDPPKFDEWAPLAAE